MLKPLVCHWSEERDWLGEVLARDWNQGRRDWDTCYKYIARCYEHWGCGLVWRAVWACQLGYRQHHSMDICGCGWSESAGGATDFALSCCTAGTGTCRVLLGLLGIYSHAGEDRAGEGWGGSDGCWWLSLNQNTALHNHSLYL